MCSVLPKTATSATARRGRRSSVVESRVLWQRRWGIESSRENRLRVDGTIQGHCIRVRICVYSWFARGSPMTYRIAIFGSSGYAGGELIRLVDGHPDLDVAYLGAHTAAGRSLGSVHPHLRDGDRMLGPNDPASSPPIDLAFLALPHGASAEPAMALLDRGTKVVDLGSDFRLDTESRYEEAYGVPHPYPEQLGRWVYGLPELHRDAIATTDRVASPGCYPTSAILPLAPLIARGLIEPTGIVVDSMSGVSGAGRGVSAALQFGAVDESAKAYKVLKHRHQPEMGFFF